MAEKALELRNVSVVKDGNRILDRFSLSIETGENVAIIGLNGSGKTTLLNLLRGNVYPYDDDSCEYFMRIFGQDRWNIFELRGKMGVVSMDLQSSFGLHTTVRELIGSGFFGSLDVFRGMTVEPSRDADGKDAVFLYQWNGSGSEGDDLYFNASVNGRICTFTVESSLCGKDSAVYKAVQGLKLGDRIDLEGFLYWYDGMNPHITAVKTAG